MNAPGRVTRRALFCGAFSAPAPGASGLNRVEGLSAGSGDVFWDGWTDADGVFVVGDDGAVFHFDGSAWTRMATPAPVPIHALWGRGRDALWAVGWMGLILRFDGTAWHKVRGCVVDARGKYSGDAENTPLFAVAGDAAGRAWAVGDHGTILRLEGESWTAEPSGTRAHLRTVLCRGDGTVMAAGGDGTVLVRDEAGDWTALACPVASNFTASLDLGADGVLVAGGRYFVDANGFRGDLVLVGDGGARTLFDGAPFSRFRALAAVRDGILAVGDGGQVHAIGGDRIDRVDSGTTHDLLGVIRLPGGEALVVGDFGTVLVGEEAALRTPAPAVRAGEAPSRWTATESGTDRQLWGLRADPATGELHACGEEGTVLILDRGKWERLPPVGALGIHALERAADGGLLAAGQLGEVHHLDGATWRKVYDLHMDVTILSLWSDGAGRLFATGDEGLVLACDEAGWRRMPSGTRSALYGLWGVDAEHLLAVGDFGLVLRWNGTRWDAFNAGTEHFLFDVWGRGLDDVTVVGLSGTIGRFDGQRWRLTPARARNDLLAVCGTDRTIAAVGAGGIAVFDDGTGWGLDPTGTDAGLRAIASGTDGAYYAAGDGGTLLRRAPAGRDD